MFASIVALAMNSEADQHLGHRGISFGHSKLADSASHPRAERIRGTLRTTCALWCGSGRDSIIKPSPRSSGLLRSVPSVRTLSPASFAGAKLGQLSGPHCAATVTSGLQHRAELEIIRPPARLDF